MALYLGKKVIATKTPLPEDIGSGATTVRMYRSAAEEGSELEYFDIYRITQEEYDSLEEAGTIDDNALYLIDGGESGDGMPEPHAATHATGGSDPITPASIGAATAGHTHTPASIGAEKERLQFTNKTVATSAFVANSTYADFGYRAAVALSGVTANMTPEVVFNVADAISGIFAPVAACYAGGVYIYASEKPSATITIPTIICWKAVG